MWLRYGRPLKGLPAMCPCGQKYNVTHALNYKKGGFAIMRHSILRDFEADMLSKIVNDVEIKQELQPVTSEIIEGLSRNASRPNISARGVRRAGQNIIFDIRWTNAHSPFTSNSQIHLTTESVLKKHEQEKKRNYNRPIMNIEHGTFTPLLFSVSEGMGKECSMFHKHVAGRLTIKTGERYEKIISTIWCKLSFLILKSALMCVTGSRSHNLRTINKFELVSHLARIE